MTAAKMRMLWRRWTLETTDVVVKDSEIDQYFDNALKALNRAVGFHITTTTLALTGGTQEYTLPVDTVAVVWVEWNGKLLGKASEEYMRTRFRTFRQDDPANPDRYYVLARTVGLHPTPSAAAVAQSGALNVRHVSDPPVFTAKSCELIPSQERVLVVIYAVAEWLDLFGAGYEQMARSERLFRRFQTETEKVAQIYAARQVQL